MDFLVFDNADRERQNVLYRHPDLNAARKWVMDHTDWSKSKMSPYIIKKDWPIRGTKGKAQ